MQLVRILGVNAGRSAMTDGSRLSGSTEAELAS